jgi:hypothetical protein
MDELLISTAGASDMIIKRRDSGGGKKHKDHVKEPLPLKMITGSSASEERCIQ